MRLLFAVLMILATGGCRFSYEYQSRPAVKPISVQKTATVTLGVPVVKPDAVAPIIPAETPLKPD